MIEALTKAEREGRLAEKIRLYARASLLIVDEIGYLPITSGGTNLFYQLVKPRHEKGAMILTSNRGFAEWGEIFGDPVVAHARLDRLLHPATAAKTPRPTTEKRRRQSHARLIAEPARWGSLTQHLQMAWGLLRENEIGHMKTDGRLTRCPIKGTIGDALFAALCVCGHSIRKILAHLSAWFAWIITRS